MLRLVLRWRIRRPLLGPIPVFLMRLRLLYWLRVWRRRRLLVAVPTAILRTIYLSNARAVVSLDLHLYMAYLGLLHLLHGRHIARIPRRYDDLWLHSWLRLLGVRLCHGRIMLARRSRKGHVGVVLRRLWLRIALMHL
jgi:hypothetical protein